MKIVRVKINPDAPVVHFPNVCPHCLEQADTVWPLGYQLMRGRYRQTFTFKVPFRQVCLDRRKSFEQRKNWLTIPVAVATVVIGAGLIIGSGSPDARPQVILWALFGWIIPYLIMNALANRIIGNGVADYKALMDPISAERVGRIGQDFMDFKVAQPEYAEKLRTVNQPNK